MKYGNAGHWGERQPICTYCELKYEIEGDYLDEYESEITCECGKKYFFQARHKIEYDSVGDCAINNELPHELIGGSAYYHCRKCRGEVFTFNFDGDKLKHSGEPFIIIEEIWDKRVKV